MPGKISADHPRFKDHPEFTPDLSPRAMLAAGVFDGGYFHGAGKEQLKGIEEAILKGGPYQDDPDPKANHFGVHSGLSGAHWKKQGWINSQDPVGWFQWYCRFASGRRSDDDERQIKRWIDYKNRWTPKTKEAAKRQNLTPKGRQALLHWAIDPATIS